MKLNIENELKINLLIKFPYLISNKNTTKSYSYYGGPNLQKIPETPEILTNRFLLKSCTVLLTCCPLLHVNCIRLI